MIAFLKNLLLALIAFAIGLLLMEFFYSFIPRRAANSFQLKVNNHEFQYTAHLNEDFFRDEPFQKEKPPGVKRIFLIGDSFAFGSGVSDENTLDKFIESELKAAGKSGYEVWNLGMPDANVRVYYQIVERFKKYRPDLVILSFYVDNDITDRWTGYWRSSNIYRLYRPFEALVDQWLFEKGWAKCRVELDFEYHPDNPYEKLACEGKINPSLIPRLRMGPNNSYYRQLARRFQEDPFTRRYLKKIRESLGDIPLVLLVFPSKYQVTTKDFPLLRKMGFPEGPQDLTSRELQEVVLSWAEEQGISTVDPLPEMRSASDQALYHPIDDHPNRTGNRLVARQLARKILDLEKGSQKPNP